MRFVDKESSLLKTALTGKTRRFARTALFFKCLTRTALFFKRTAYKQSSQKKDFFKIFGGVDNLLTGCPVKRFEDRKFAALRLLFRLAAAQQGRMCVRLPLGIIRTVALSKAGVK